MSRKLTASHGVVCRLENNTFGYFGWPTVTVMDDGTLIAACSGFRIYHICPFGKTVMFYSFDKGNTWTPPMVVNDSSLDDRDAGLINLGGKKLLLSWFNLETWFYNGDNIKKIDNSAVMHDYEKNLCKALIDNYNEKMNEKEAGSFVRISNDLGVTWESAHKVPVSAPHGPCLLGDGRLIYLGRDYIKQNVELKLSAWISEDEGVNWLYSGTFSLPEGVEWKNFCEPHAIQLPGGRILAHIRFQDYEKTKAYKEFTIFQTVSDDYGKTWSTPELLDVSGSPPHLLIHSSGALICTYGRREKPYGQMAMISTDNGDTWSKDWVIRDDGKDHDLGYPSSVELDDGSIFTVYYQKYGDDEKSSVLWSKWSLPQQFQTNKEIRNA